MPSDEIVFGSHRREEVGERSGERRARVQESWGSFTVTSSRRTGGWVRFSSPPCAKRKILTLNSVSEDLGIFEHLLGRLLDSGEFAVTEE
jgi:hypothetical protein